MSISGSTQEALASQKRRSLKETREKLELALLRMVNGNPEVVIKGTKISAASVSKEAGVDRVTLYRYHEPVLVKIRKVSNALPVELLKESKSELADKAAKMREYRQLVEEAQDDVATLARINYRLNARISELEELIRVRDGIIKEMKAQLNESGLKPKISTFKGNRPH